MSESANQPSSRQRRANWVGLRTLRQLPKAAGETAAGEPVYEVRSIRLMLDVTGANFVRVASCSRCGRELGGAAVLTPLDLDRPVRPMICTDCIRQAGVSTVWDSEGVEPAGFRPAAEVPAPEVEEEARPPAPPPAQPPPPPPADWAVDERQVARVDAMERHLRAVTDRVNELGRVARANQADGQARAEREDAAAVELRAEVATIRPALEEAWRQQAEREAAASATVREELAALRAALEEVRRQGEGAVAPAADDVEEGRQLREDLAALRAERDVVAAAVGEELASLRAEVATVRAALEEVRAQAGDGRLGVGEAIEKWQAERAGQESGAGVDEHVAHLAGLVEAQRAEEAGLAAAMTDLRAVVEATTGATRELARGHDTLDRRLTEALARFGASQADAAMVDEAVTSRLAEAEGRLSHQIAGQWGDLETAIEASVAAHVAGTAGAGDALAAGQSLLEERLDALAGQLAEVASRLSALADRPVAQQLPAPAPAHEPAGDFLEALDRQLDAAARRLAARSGGSGEG